LVFTDFRLGTPTSLPWQPETPQAIVGLAIDLLEQATTTRSTMVAPLPGRAIQAGAKSTTGSRRRTPPRCAPWATIGVAIWPCGHRRRTDAYTNRPID